MTIHLPNDLENSVQAAVRTGRFASVDDAMAKAVRLLLAELNAEPPANPSPNGDLSDPVLGCMRDDAGLMDEIVADAYRHRQEEGWREFDL
jgi:Arc/MetJ-type ribon-helix-helix transcriptional regulator